MASNSNSRAPLKALWPSVYMDAQGQVIAPNPIPFLSTTAQGRTGRGDVPVADGGNLGFLRKDPVDPSLLAIVVVTDEDDCSARTTEFMLPTSQLSMDSPYYLQDLNLRCFFNPTLLYDTALRYYRGFRALRPGNEQRVVFAGIGGVPVDLVDEEAREALDLTDTTSIQTFYDGILDDERMQPRIDSSTNPGTGTGTLAPTCVRTDANGGEAKAYPARRIVELAKSFGSNGMIQSICQDDFTPAIDAVIDMMAHRISDPCGE